MSEQIVRPIVHKHGLGCLPVLIISGLFFAAGYWFAHNELQVRLAVYQLLNDGPRPATATNWPPAPRYSADTSPFATTAPAATDFAPRASRPAETPPAHPAPGPAIASVSEAHPAVLPPEIDDYPKRGTIFDPTHAGEFRYGIMRIWWADHVGRDHLSSSGEYGRRLDWPHLFIQVQVTNEGNRPASIPRLSMLDSRGREYEPSAEGSLTDDALSAWDRLNPGAIKMGVIHFDVGYGAEGQYRLHLPAESPTFIRFDVKQPKE